MTASVTIKRQNLVPIAVSAAIGLSVAFVAPALPPVVEVVVLGAPMLQSAAVLRGGSISAGAVTLSAPARTSSAVVRAAVVVPGVVDLVAPKIASGAVLRGGAAENLNASEIVLIAPFLLSAPTLRSAAVAPQEVSLVAPALGSGAVLRSAGVAPGEVALVAPSLPSAAVLRVGAIAPLSVTLAPPFLLSSSILRGGAIENITGGYEAEAQAYFDGMTVKPSSTDMTAYNAFILDGKANGWWSILDRLYIHGAHHEQAARVNMKRPANVAFHGQARRHGRRRNQSFRCRRSDRGRRRGYQLHPQQRSYPRLLHRAERNFRWNIGSRRREPVDPLCAGRQQHGSVFVEPLQR
jgi:hypothetical protein